MKKILTFKLHKTGYVYIIADTISAVRLFGEGVRIYLSGGMFFDVEDTLEEVLEIIREVR